MMITTGDCDFNNSVQSCNWHRFPTQKGSLQDSVVQWVCKITADDDDDGGVVTGCVVTVASCDRLIVPPTLLPLSALDGLLRGK